MTHPSPFNDYDQWTMAFRILSLCQLWDHLPLSPLIASSATNEEMPIVVAIRQILQNQSYILERLDNMRAELATLDSPDIDYDRLADAVAARLTALRFTGTAE